MPALVQNVKNYFELIQLQAKNMNLDKLNINAKIENGQSSTLFTDSIIKKALNYLICEVQSIKQEDEEVIKKNPNHYLHMLDLIMVLFSVHQEYGNEYTALKIYQKIAKFCSQINEYNLANARAAFLNFLHDTKSFIPEKSVITSRQLAIHPGKCPENLQNFIIDLSKYVFKSEHASNPNVKDLLNGMLKLKSQYQSFFDKGRIDSYIATAYFDFFKYTLLLKATKFNLYSEKFNDYIVGYRLRRIGLKILSYMQRIRAELYSGTFDTLYYVWNGINFLLNGMHIIAETSTLTEKSRERLVHQLEYLQYANINCVPSRVKLAIRMIMHSDFISQHITELGIRYSQLYAVEHEKISTFVSPTTDLYSLNSDIDIVVRPVNELDNYLDGNLNAQIKNEVKYTVTINSTNNGAREVGLEDCFLKKCLYENEFLEALSIVRSYIWKISKPGDSFSHDSDWEKLFIPPKKDTDSYSKEELELTMNIRTPENSPTHKRSPTNCHINAPLKLLKRWNRRLPTTGQQSNTNINNDDNPPIETCGDHRSSKVGTISKNIRFESPEIPLASGSEMLLKPNEENNDSTIEVLREQMEVIAVNPDKPSLIEYFERHIRQFKHYSLPVIHRPMCQRLAMHYLWLGSHELAAFYLSLSVNIAFRQSYHADILQKLSIGNLHRQRWEAANTVLNRCLQDEKGLHTTMLELLPSNWTLLQLTMMDEIPITSIKSSLLDNGEGGCLGARNVSVLLATKYQKRVVKGEQKLTVETRILHGFRQTGLQLIDQMGKMHADSLDAMKTNTHDRNVWWNDRFAFEDEMEGLVRQMTKDWLSKEELCWLMDQDTPMYHEPKILIPDRNVCCVPWEAILASNSASVSCITRMPNIASVLGHLAQLQNRQESTVIGPRSMQINPGNAYYVVNPDLSLKKTEEVMVPLFRNMFHWDGLCGKQACDIDAVQLLTAKDMLIYCGHGSGGQYFSDKSLKNVTSITAMFIIGCSSGRYRISGRSEAFAFLSGYLTVGCPAVLGLLWAVTDGEIDKLTTSMFKTWLNNSRSTPIDHNMQSETYVPRAPLPSFVRTKDVMDSVKLKMMTGQSVVIYGVPIWTKFD